MLQVKSFSHLFSDELRRVDSFLVCGEEKLPPELKHQKDMADEWMEKAKNRQRDSGHSSISTR